MPDEIEGIEGIEGEEPEGGGEPEERTYAGVFKSPEELEKGYVEARAEMTRKEQEAADLRRQLESTQGREMNPPEVGDPNEVWWENPAQAAYATFGGLLNQFQSAQANVRRASSQYKNDSAYNLVRDEFEAELASVPFNIMADPNQAQQAADYVYNTVCGRKFRETQGKIKENPSSRLEVLKQLGVEPPAPGPDNNVNEDVTQSDIAALRSMGLQGKDLKDAVDSYKKGKGDL